MSDRADAHIHLFEQGYQGDSFAHRPGVSLDEAACFESLMQEHRVTAALVVGYAGQPWCARNNEYLAQILPQRHWVKPTAFVDVAEPPTMAELEARRQQGFVGLSLYVFGEEQTDALLAIADDFWRFAADSRWLLSVNSKGEAWRAWSSILERHDQVRLIVSHLGLPPRVGEPPADASALQSVTDLARYPRVHVKLSGFYALSAPGHDYPHRAAWPYAEALAESFGTTRLLWGSDFSPCLDHLSYPQSLGVLRHLPFLTEADRARIEGANLLRLLSEVDQPS